MTTFYPDISGYQAGIDLKGAPAVCCKATEGTGYTNPDYARAMGDAAKNGAFFFAYHFLHAGNVAAQAAYCYSVAGKTPLMVDVEPTGSSAPSLTDLLGFVSAYRALGGVVHLVYLPHWYWLQMGSPSLAKLPKQRLALVSSLYTVYSDQGPGWQPYGDVTPEVWQYTDSEQFNGKAVDFNAFKGTLVELEEIVKTGRISPVRHVADGTYSLNHLASHRGTTAAHIVTVSFANLGAVGKLAFAKYLLWPGRKNPMPKGLVYWTSH